MKRKRQEVWMRRYSLIPVILLVFRHRRMSEGGATSGVSTLVKLRSGRLPIIN
jgi:hypothetical protein